MTRICRRCHDERPVEDFPWAKRDVLRRRVCIDCERTRKRAERANNPDAQKAAVARYRERHPDRHSVLVMEASERWAWKNVGRVQAAQRRYRLQKKYGLTVEDYNQMLRLQGNTCGICGSANPGKGKKHFSVDHCHRFNVVRGLICSPCNLALGRFGDDPEWFRRAADYLEISYEYWSRKRAIGL